MNSQRFTFALSLAAAALVALPASASIVPDNYPTIQAAVNAAPPGETIRVRPGRYNEAITVPVGKNGITIAQLTGGTCTDNGLVIIDTQGGGGSTGIDVDSANVTVRCLTIRNSSSDGIYTDREGLHLDKVKIVYAGDSGVEIYGQNWNIENSEFIGAQYPIYVGSGKFGRATGNNIRGGGEGCTTFYTSQSLIENNVVADCEDSYGYYVEGNQNIIRGNSGDSSEYEMFYVYGDNNQVLLNTAVNSNEYACFYVDGQNPLVEGNNATACTGGYDITGRAPVVRANHSTNSWDDYGYDIYCDNACASMIVDGNHAFSVSDDYSCYYISEAVDGGTVTNNFAERCVEYGLDLSLNSATITGNNVTRNGAESEDGMYVSGNLNTITNNTATWNNFDGIVVAGNSNLIQQNIASNNGEDGIQLASGDANTIKGNTTNNNHAEGIENDGTNSVIKNNNSSGNRRDCASDGSIAVQNNNACADGSNFTLPGQTDH